MSIYNLLHQNDLDLQSRSISCDHCSMGTMTLPILGHGTGPEILYYGATGPTGTITHGLLPTIYGPTGPTGPTGVFGPTGSITLTGPSSDTTISNTVQSVPLSVTVPSDPGVASANFLIDNWITGQQVVQGLFKAVSLYCGAILTMVPGFNVQILAQNPTASRVMSIEDQGHDASFLFTSVPLVQQTVSNSNAVTLNARLGAVRNFGTILPTSAATFQINNTFITATSLIRLSLSGRCIAVTSGSNYTSCTVTEVSRAVGSVIVTVQNFSTTNSTAGAATVNIDVLS